MSTYLLEMLPPEIGDPGTEISLSTILTDAFGPGWDGYTDFSVAWYGAAALAYWDFHYWDPNDPSVSKWLDNGTAIKASTVSSYKPIDLTASEVPDFTLQLGNDIAPYLYLTVQIGTDSSIQYEINVVAPGLEAPPSGVDGEPTPQDIVDSAYRYANLYTGVLNPNDCGFIASDLTAAAGAPLDDQVSESLIPSENSSAGFWRVVYRGSDPNPLSNWQTLLQPGDVVRMGWSGGGQHTTTVLSVNNSDGTMVVFDNENTNNNGDSFISVHTVNYDTVTIPDTITIFRLTTDHLYLIDGSAGGQILNGTLQYDNEIITSGETQVVNCGPHNDVVDITAASTGTMTINGGGGQDTVVYTSLAVEGAQFTGSNGESLTIVNGTIYVSPGEGVIVSWSGGSDTLNGISSVQFTDETINVAPCYCPGTLIKTPCGETAVERLKIGDDVVTASGMARPVKWIGRRSYGGRFVRGSKEILPVCIKAGAVDDNVPKRDLWISPHHAMFLDGVLIEAKDLINGVSIVQAEHVENVEYFHIELDTHDVIIAEGALSESFIDDDSRGMFHNAHEYAALYADEIHEPAGYCAPRLGEGYEVEAVRMRLAQRAGLSAAATAAPRLGALRGYIDRISATRIAGWAQNSEAPEAPVCLDVFVHAKLVGRVLANTYRDDLARAGLGSGRHAFDFMLPAGLDVSADAVEVRRSLDGASLQRSRAGMAGAPQSLPVRDGSSRQQTNVKVYRRAARGC